MTTHWSDRKPHPFAPSVSHPKHFPICAICQFGPNHPLHQVTEERKAA